MSTASVDHPALFAELATALDAWGVIADDGIPADQSLIRSGLLDSVALFNLSLWVEQRVGAPVDPTSFDVVRAWDTMETIVAFVAARRGSTAPGPSSALDKNAAPIPSTVARPPAAARPTLKSARRSGLRIVQATAAHADVVAKLQTRLWSPSVAQNRAFYLWKYFENPFDDQPIVHLVFDAAGEPIATRGFCPSVWEAALDAASPGTRFSWYCVDDLVVMPGHENRGVFALLVEAGLEEMAQRGQSHYLSLSALRVSRLQSLATGSQSLGGMNPHGRRRWTAAVVERLDRTLRRLPVAWRHAPSLRRTAAARAFARLDAMAPIRVRDATLTLGSASDGARMAALVAALPYDGRIRHVRDAAYFRWRYRNPLHDHRFLYLTSGNALLGYLVLERALSDHANGMRINVVDWEAQAPEHAEALMTAAMRFSAAPEIVTWAATLDSPRRDILYRCGMRAIDVEQSERGLPSILIRPVNHAALRAAGRDLLSLADWDLRMIYTNAV